LKTYSTLVLPNGIKDIVVIVVQPSYFMSRIGFEGDRDNYSSLASICLNEGSIKVAIYILGVVAL
jgi:hypothetical protein